MRRSLKRMEAVSRARPPRTLENRAIDNLRYIRETMENAGAFTAVPGWGGVGMGCVALIGSGIAARTSATDGFLAVWLSVALVAAAIGSVSMTRKARRAGIRLLAHAAGRRFMLSLGPPLVAAGVLTVVLHGTAAESTIPGVWLLLYGAGVVAAGSFSVRAVPLMGGCFMALGVVALFGPASWANLMMAIGFGLLQIVFGVIIARRHGG